MNKYNPTKNAIKKARRQFAKARKAGEGETARASRMAIKSLENAQRGAKSK